MVDIYLAATVTFVFKNVRTLVEIIPADLLIETSLRSNTIPRNGSNQINFLKIIQWVIENSFTKTVLNN